MTASNFAAEQMLEKVIAWLKSHKRITPEVEVGLREYCRRSETDKQRALRLLQMHGCADTLRLSTSQVELIRSVVERCPDDHSQFFVKADGIMQGPPPAPSKPKLAVGQVWRRRDGQAATVDRFYNTEQDGYPFRAGSAWYTDDGRYNVNWSSHPLDLVECLYDPCEH